MTNLKKRQLYDRRDIDPWELKLVRVGHALWRMYKNAQTAGDLREIGPLYEALETVWRLKREYRAELGVRRNAEKLAMQEKFRANAKGPKRQNGLQISSREDVVPLGTTFLVRPKHSEPGTPNCAD